MAITREQLEKAAKVAGYTHVRGFSDKGAWWHVDPDTAYRWQPHIDRGQLLDLAMACRIAIEPRADFIIYDVGSKSKVVDVNCQDFPALAEAVILAACEQFDAKGGAA